ncbi:MAG: dihydrolipoyl dehydrogenase [Alphaproteobacteria bacterium]|nr:dihydrolipoyl dehydrogenase [Alphaproteobacteria bacterium]
MSFSSASDTRDPSNNPGLFSQSLPKDPFDVIVIGGGPGGYVAAIRAAQLGLKTALVEGKHLGGVCLNWGCIPTKALLKSASMLASASYMESFGLTLPSGDIGIDLGVMVRRSRQLANTLQLGIKGLLAKNGVSVFSAWASFEPLSAVPNGPSAPQILASSSVSNGPHPTTDSLAVSKDSWGQTLVNSAHPAKVRTDKSHKTVVHTLRLTNTHQEIGHLFGKNIVIATGARARTLFPDDLGIWSASQAMTPEKRPESILIIGAGAIGIEFASFYRTLGTDVTVVEQSDTILPIEDAEIVAIASQSFIQQGIILETGCTVNHVVKNQDDSYTAIIKNLKTGVEKSWTGERVLVAIGVIGNTEHLGLDHTAVRTEKGHIVTHAHHTTDELGVYAIGDVAGAPWLAHKASHEGVACIEYIAGLNPQPSDPSLIPGCTYSMPQIASIGLTERAAAAQGAIKVGRFPFAANGQAMAYGESTGLVKVIFDEQTGELLGAHMVGAGVSELIQGFVIAKTMQATEADLQRVIFPHPTFSEMMHEAVLDADHMGLHLFRAKKAHKKSDTVKPQS